MGKVADVEREVFGPVLHVLRYRREALDALIDAVNAAGYGLTFGLHTRIDETIARVAERIEAGNVYVNRNIIGATVGVQPFGGSRLSGTGPKAGGPLYLARLVAEPPSSALDGLEGDGAALGALARLHRLARAPQAMRRKPNAASASWRARRSARASSFPDRSASATSTPCAGAGGSRRSRRATARRSSRSARSWPPATTRSSARASTAALKGLPPEFGRRVETVLSPLDAPALAGALIAGDADAVSGALGRLAARPGPIVRLQALTPARLAAGEDYDLTALVEERVVATNTAAAGGNASLMTIG